MAKQISDDPAREARKVAYRKTVERKHLALLRTFTKEEAAEVLLSGLPDGNCFVLVLSGAMNSKISEALKNLPHGATVRGIVEAEKRGGLIKTRQFERLYYPSKNRD